MRRFPSEEPVMGDCGGWPAIPTTTVLVRNARRMRWPVLGVGNFARILLRAVRRRRNLRRMLRCALRLY